MLAQAGKEGGFPKLKQITLTYITNKCDQKEVGVILKKAWPSIGHSCWYEDFNSFACNNYGLSDEFDGLDADGEPLPYQDDYSDYGVDGW